MHSELKIAIKENNLVFFIGSGFSEPLGYPNWNRLVENILEELSLDYTELEGLKSLVGTSLFSQMEILDKLVKYRSRIHKILNKEFSVIGDNKELLKRHKKIGNITSKIITTNYDKALESANTDFRKITYDNDFHVSQLNSADKYIYKLHGCIEDPTSCILFTDDYKKLYDNSTSAIEELKKIIGDKTIVFLGFSLSDPYVMEQFQYINTIYNGLKGMHFLITTENSNNLEGIDILKIDNWDDSLDELLEDFLKIKNEKENSLLLISTPQPMVIENIPTIKIAILIASPINKNFGYETTKIQKQFSNMDVKIDFYPFTIATLNGLEGYKFILIFTSSIQNKVYLEDENLVSKLISMENLQSEFLSDDINCLFIFSDRDEILNANDELYLPIVFKKYDDKTFNSFVFKTFRKADIKNLKRETQLINENQINLLRLTQGKAQISHTKSELPIEIDRKRLINFTGRASDLENIIRKIHELNGQFLTIKASGGIGKTTTIKKVAIELADRGYYSDGIHFIDCEFISDLNTFEYKVGQCFDLDRTINLKEHMIQNINNIDKMIILDNFESLLYLNDTKEIKNLVAFLCDYATIITTSRQWIGFEFEEKYELRALTTDECVALFQKYYTNEINSSEMKILRHDIIENLLNNNPLAIKIITTNIPKLKSMNLLKMDLEEDFFDTTQLGFDNIFVESVDSNIERSKSLYQSINYSYTKLSNKEKLVFELLSLFPDGIHVNSFVQMFKGVEYSKDINKVTDKEIKNLENKSLLQSSSTTIKLQSIVGRFASHKFKDRSINEKQEYYDKAYQFNTYLLYALQNMPRENQPLGIFDNNMENLFNSLNYLEHVSTQSKWNLLKYIATIATYSNLINQGKKYENHIRRLTEFFEDVDKSEILIEVLIFKLRYYEGEFKESLNGLQELLPLDKFFELPKTNKEIDDYIYSNAAGIYKYGNELEFINQAITNRADKQFWGKNNDLLFSIGAYKLINEKIINENKDLFINDFFILESLNNLGNLDLENLNNRISRVYKKEHLSLMQLTYIKAKMGEVTKKEVKNLVVVNPYTFGLKNLMYAFLEKDHEKANHFYNTAIENLKHIKYYYVEAIYHYATYLKYKDINEYDFWVIRGIELARKYQYRFLIHRFECLFNDDYKPYIEENYEFDLEFDYIRKTIRPNKELVLIN